MRHFGSKGVSLAIAALTVSGAADAAGFNQFVGFGDSTMDSGYFRYNATGSSSVDAAVRATVAAGGSGAFAGPAVVDTTLLAAKFGLSATPYRIGGGGGTNYANGAAQTVASYADDGYNLPANVPTVTQISNYLASVHGAANPDALYMVSTGGNDVSYVQTGASVSPTYLQTQASLLAASVASLQAAGARTIVVLNVYDDALLVDANGTLSPTNAASVARTSSYSAAIWSDLSARGVNFIPADVEDVLTYVSRNPTQFGFSPATILASSPACTTSSALVCAPSQLVSSNAEQTYLFSDSHHLTTAGQTVEADYIYSLLVAPSQMSLLAESAVQSGLARAATVQGQIDLSAQHRGPSGVNAWSSAGANSLSVKNTPAYPRASGIPFGGTVGLDYLTTVGIIVGAAVSVGRQAQGFSSGGHFDQTDEALSLYAAGRDDVLWGNAVASGGLSQNHTVRHVTLGAFTDQNYADSDGQSLALALRGGGDVHVGPLITGPVAGMVLQRIHLNGFAERGVSGMTALAFGTQTRDSAVSQFGWRGAVNVDDWQPFAEVAWNHEWAGKNRTITTSLTSIAAPSYASAAAPITSDWGTASLGTSYTLNAEVTLRGAASAMFGNPQTTGYGGELGMNVTF